MQEKEAKQQVAVLNQRLHDKEQQVVQLGAVIDATEADGQRRISDIRSVNLLPILPILSTEFSSINQVN